MAIEASIVVVFGEQEPGADDLVVVEFDPNYGDINNLPDGNLDEDGNLKSTFDPDDEPVFLLHHSDTLRVNEVRSSDGSVGLLSLAVPPQTREKDIQFVKKDETTSLGYDHLTIGTTNWMGNEGVVDLINESELKLVGGPTPCIGTHTFSVTFQRQYQLHPPALNLAPDETYEILVVIYMEVI